MQKYCFLSVFLDFKSKNEQMILVTGATGLVGGNLIWHLLKENDRIVAIRRRTSNPEVLRVIFSFYTSTPDEFLDRIDWKIADVLDKNSISEAMQNISVVYHCAAIVSFADNSETISETNVTGTRNVVRSALENNIRKLCFVSSIAACGRSVKDGPIDEETVWKESSKHSPYKLSKYYSEQEVWKGIQEGLNAVIVNPGVILGISGTKTGSSELFLRVKKGLKFYTKGGSGYVDVQDVVQAMILLTKSDISGKRFILVGENCSNRDIINWMADGFGNRRPVICIGKTILWIVGCLSELTGKVFNFRPLIDRATARTISHREYYSGEKIKNAIEISFKPIELCIHDVCKFQKQGDSK
jgi:dihydroflavonol-4-reductase